MKHAILERDETAFQNTLSERADLAADWLLKSIGAHDGKGSAAYYSRVYEPVRGWSDPYPETTGYIIPTLLAYSSFSGRDLNAVAFRLADWLCSLQYEDSGAFPGGLLKNGHKGAPSIFNSGQIIKGLVATGDSGHLESARRAARWLAETVDLDAGTWTAHAYRDGYSPAYYSQVCWPMLAVASRTGDEMIRERALLVLNTIAGWQLPNGAIRNWGFGADQPAFTHTIAYTLRGLIESADLLDSDGAHLLGTAQKAAEVLRRRTDIRGRLAGSYTEALKGTYWYSCLTGNCQMAIVWSKLWQATGDIRYLNTAVKVFQHVLSKQRLRGATKGGIAGSSPLWGRYLIFRYPNWAAKYFIDAALRLHDDLTRVQANGPCA